MSSIFQNINILNYIYVNMYTEINVADWMNVQEKCKKIG